MAVAGQSGAKGPIGPDLITRALLFVKHHVPIVWRMVEWLNASLFVSFHGRRLEDEAAQCFREFLLDGYVFRPVIYEDLRDLKNLLDKQSEERLEHFRPHDFDLQSLENSFRNPAFLMFGVFFQEDIVGYFFLRCFWNRRCFVGRLIDEHHDKQGIGRVMNQIMYHTAWRSAFKCHTTISKNNAQVMRSHANNPAVRVLRELPNNYLFIEFVNLGTITGLSRSQSALKRSFDLVSSIVGLLITGWIIAIAWILSTISTGANGFFTQQRVGRYGQLFTAIKIRTMRDGSADSTNVTTSKDPRITPLGRIWRRTKIDELPQLWNVLVGKMSFVGPRPDVPGFADKLVGDDRIILSVRPGITGPATLQYRDEESLLASVEDPESYNHDVIYPDKVRINREYVENWSFWGDIRYILATLLGKS